MIDHRSEGNGYEGSSNRQRKKYTIRNPRQQWTPEEHRRFVEAIRLYKRDWASVRAHVGTRTVIQIRSHAQKYFLKLQKLGREDCIPPRRNKMSNSRTRVSSAASKHIQSTRHRFQKTRQPLKRKLQVTQVSQLDCKRGQDQEWVPSHSKRHRPTRFTTSKKETFELTEFESKRMLSISPKTELKRYSFSYENHLRNVPSDRVRTHELTRYVTENEKLHQNGNRSPCSSDDSVATQEQPRDPYRQSQPLGQGQSPRRNTPNSSTQARNTYNDAMLLLSLVAG
mmetsp:Transcript_22307/g.33236  ORF Transcript_22307/g.33236 Transcript_22307/m.33236 type:complete len:282 (+) Transcript_22307:177-1022(+)